MLSTWMATYLIDFIVGVLVSVDYIECAPRLAPNSQDEAVALAVAVRGCPNESESVMLVGLEDLVVDCL